ncbi:ribonuclease T2 isoform 2-T2 [Pholidichthys leucotaenia]
MRLSSAVLVAVSVTLASSFISSSPQMWTKLVLTQQWPTTFCSMVHCHQDINYWTLHGLWTDKMNDCNSSWHFNASEIEDLLPDMDKSWPDLLTPVAHKLQHEWQKHGTCAAKLTSLNSQHKYFSKALELYHTLDLDGTLRKFDIIPSEKYYNFSQIEGVVEKFYGIKPKIQCAQQSKNDAVQILGQIEICLDPEFNLQDCENKLPMENIPEKFWDVNTDSGYRVCDHDIQVYYPPLQ